MGLVEHELVLLNPEGGDHDEVNLGGGGPEKREDPFSGALEFVNKSRSGSKPIVYSSSCSSSTAARDDLNLDVRALHGDARTIRVQGDANATLGRAYDKVKRHVCTTTTTTSPPPPLPVPALAPRPPPAAATALLSLLVGLRSVGPGGIG